MDRTSGLGAVAVAALLVLSTATSIIYAGSTPPSFDVAGMNASMRNAYRWVVSRTLPNGTATLPGTTNNLLSTSLVGRVLTYVQLEVGNATTLALAAKMADSAHILLQNTRYITLGIWPVADVSYQLQVHRDVQKFLARAYALTLNSVTRSDFVSVTRDIYLNRPTKYEYFDTLAWSFANAVWYAHYNGSPLPPPADFSDTVQDLNLQYNKTAATADSANSFIDYARLMHYLVPLEFTDGYYRLAGNSLDPSYLSLETQLANQLLTRQLSNGNVSSAKPYKAYLVEDFARDMDSAYYLSSNQNYVSAAFRSEAFLTGLYLQSNGNITMPKSGTGFDPFIAFHLISIAKDIKAYSSGNWYTSLSQASLIIGRTLAIQSSEGTFRYYMNTTNPGYAYSTIGGVSTIADSYVILRESGVIGTQTSSTASVTSGTSRTSTVTSSTGTASTNTATTGTGQTSTTTTSGSTLSIPDGGSSTQLSCNHASVSVGATLSCRVIVLASGAIPNGTVWWSSGGAGRLYAQSCKLVSSTCLVRYLASTAAGSVSITASYAGDGFHSSSSGAFALRVSPKATKTAVVCSPGVGKVGGIVTCKALVTGYHPGGTVFWSGAGGTGSIAFSSPGCSILKGQCHVRAWTWANHTSFVMIRASYGGDVNNINSSWTRKLTLTCLGACVSGAVWVGPASSGCKGASCNLNMTGYSLGFTRQGSQTVQYYALLQAGGSFGIGVKSGTYSVSLYHCTGFGTNGLPTGCAVTCPWTGCSQLLVNNRTTTSFPLTETILAGKDVTLIVKIGTGLSAFAPSLAFQFMTVPSSAVVATQGDNGVEARFRGPAS